MNIVRFLRQILKFGTKKYKCTNCKKTNRIKDNKEITVGFCWNCEHPIWNH